MKKLIVIAVLLLGVFSLYGCGSGGGGGSSLPVSDGGDTGGGTPPPPGSPQLASIELTASKYSVTSNGTDVTTLTVFAKDVNNAALPDAVIGITATAGLVNTPVVTTGANGTATFTFSAGAEKTNRVATVTAASGNRSKSLPISIVGTTLTLNASKGSTKPADPSPIIFTGEVRDANNNPLFGAQLTLSSLRGNVFTDRSNALNTGTTITLTSDVSGIVRASYAGNVIGSDTVSLKGMGSQQDTVVSVSNSTFGFTAPVDNSVVPVNASQPVTVTWRDEAGNPKTGEVITFALNSGSLSSTTAIVDANGEAIVTFTASSTASPATVTARNSDSSLTDALTFDVRALNSARIDLQASPSVVTPSVGELTSTSTITATVRDASNNAVAGKIVTFNLFKGPGGGEFLSPVTAITNAGGQAVCTFTSGSSVSAQNGVVVQATVADLPGQFGETKLTIGQQAASIVIGSTNKISRVSVGGLEIGYALPFSVLVVDNNGNPIPGAIVNLGVYPLRFYTGTIGSPYLRSGMFNNEDINRNGILDPQEDGAEGVLLDGAETPTIAVWVNGAEGQPAVLMADPAAPKFGNGKLDPHGVVSIPMSVTTDDSGMAAFEVKYAKSYASWVDVEIIASTQVIGSQSSAKLEAPLTVMEGDEPFPVSPFGELLPAEL